MGEQFVLLKSLLSCFICFFEWFLVGTVNTGKVTQGRYRLLLQHLVLSVRIQ